MNKLKKMFEKKKAEFKFEKAGTGYKLSDSSKPAASSSSSQHQHYQQQQQPMARTRHDGPDANVARAALARFENKNPQKNSSTPFALRDIMEQEKRQISEEMKLKEQLLEQQKLKERKLELESVNPFKEFENQQRFTCLSLDINDPVPFDILISKIKSSIFDNFNDDSILRSIMCLFNCNRLLNQDDSRIKACLDILKKIVTNLTTDDPTELEKFKRVRRSKIEQKVLSLDGALDFLFAIGFSIDSNDNDWLVYSELSSPEELKTKMSYILDLLSSPQVLPIEFDHQLKHMRPDDLKSAEEDDALQLTSADVKQYYSHLERTREVQEMFVSKDTKAKLLGCKTNHKPIFAQLRFKYPTDNGMKISQANFYSTDKLSDIKSWFVANMIDEFPCNDLDFKIGPELLSNESHSKSLFELQLAPAATLFVIAK